MCEEHQTGERHGYAAAAKIANHHMQSLFLPRVKNRFEKTISDLDNDPIDTVEPTTEQALQWLLRHEGECEGAT